MVDPVIATLESIGPSLSSKVAAELSCRFKMSPANARQRVSRAGATVRKLAGIPFPRNARFVYLDKQFGSPQYWKSLEEALLTCNSALGYALAALRQYGGIVPTRQFAIICGSPVRQLKHLAADTVLERLKSAGLVKTSSGLGIGECVCLVQDDDYLLKTIPKLRARLVTETILLNAVRDWMRRLGLASYNLVGLRSEERIPKIGTFAWDLSAPSYISGIVRFTREGTPKPGFVACDVILGEDITSAGARPFIRKCETLRALRNVSPCIQILIGDRFHRDAFKELRTAGIIATTPESLFGKDVARALHELTSVLLKIAKSVYDVDALNKIFKTLGKIQGVSNQLRGSLFEYMVADIVGSRVPGQIQKNRIVKSADGRKAEIDVVAISSNRTVLAIECKGYSPYSTIPDELFKRWLQHNVPVSYSYYRNHPEFGNLSLRFEFWTTAPISDEMLALFNNAKGDIKSSRYEIALVGPEDIWNACSETRDKGLIDTYRNHFTMDDGSMTPLSRARTSAPIIRDHDNNPD